MTSALRTAAPLPRVLPRRSSPRTRHSPAQEFYADIKRQAKAFDRHPDQIKVLPGISPFITSMQVESDRLQDEFNELIQPEYSLTQLRQMIGLDLSGFDLDGPFPRHLIDTEGARGVASRFRLVVDTVDREKPTIRPLCRPHRLEQGPDGQGSDHREAYLADQCEGAASHYRGAATARYR